MFIFAVFSFLNLTASIIGRDSLIIESYPVGVNNEWKYSRTFQVVVYDTINNDTTVYLFNDTLHEWFDDIDTLAGWECFRLQHILYGNGDSFPQTWWYAHPDTALLWIAYTYNNTKFCKSSRSATNIKFRYKGICFNTAKSLAQYLYLRRFYPFQFLGRDTMYWSPPKKLFVFPLTIGSYWIAMTDPWLEEREVVGEDTVNVPGGTFAALVTKITSEWMTENDLCFNWLSEEGVVKDSFHILGEALDSLGNVIGYCIVDDIYLLIDYHLDIKEDIIGLKQFDGKLSIYPNPCRSSLFIQFYTTKPSHNSTLEIYSAAGQQVKTITDFKTRVGFQSIIWDCLDKNGKKVSPGIYFCYIKTDNFVASKKFIVLH